jgi:heat shock protein HslJ
LLGLWRWTGTRLQDGTTVAPPDPGQYTITFNSNNTANIQADCNQATANWNVSGNQLTIAIINQTQAACDEDSLSDQYLAWLGAASNYSLNGSALTIDLSQDSGQMTFAR